MGKKMEMFWTLLFTCLVVVIIWKLRELLVRVSVWQLVGWLVQEFVWIYWTWVVEVIVSKLGERLVERWVVEPIVYKIESIVCKVAGWLVKKIGLVEKIICKVAEWLVIEIGCVLDCYEIGYVRSCKDNTHGLKVVVDVVIVKLRDLEDTALSVTEWQKRARSAIEEAIKVLKDAERAYTKRFLGFCPDLKALYQLSRNAEKQMQVFARLQGLIKLWI